MIQRGIEIIKTKILIRTGIILLVLAALRIGFFRFARTGAPVDAQRTAWLES